MQRSMRTISSSYARSNFGYILSSLYTHGPLEITRNGKPVGLLTLPPEQTVDRSRIAALAIAYSKGLISWQQISEETRASYGDLLLELGLNNLQIPTVTHKKTPAQVAVFHRILDLAAAKMQINLTKDDIPMTGLPEFIATLAQRHGVVYKCTGQSALAQVITGLAGDDVKPDATEQLVIAMRKAGVIDGLTMLTLLGRYFDETSR